MGAMSALNLLNIHRLVVIEYSDTDECQEPGVCSHGKCLNTDGSFRCVCQIGYHLNEDGTRCLGT